MSFQLQQAAIAAELRKAGIPADAANRLASILGNSVQQVRSGPQTQDLTPSAMRKITPHVRKYHLQNVDFLEGDPDYRQAQTQPSEDRKKSAQASTVRSDTAPQQSRDSYRVGQGEFTQVRTEGDRVSVGLRVKKTGSFVTQDPTSGTLVGRNIRVQSKTGDKGLIRLSMEEAGSDVVIKLDVDDAAFGNDVTQVISGDGVVTAPVTTEPCPSVTCSSDSDCGSGCLCGDGVCTAAECGPSDRCPDNGICVDGRCVECVNDAQCQEGQPCINGTCVEPSIDDPLLPPRPPNDGSCTATTCGDDGSCGDGCVCIDGDCYPSDAAYYCCYEELPDSGQPLPASRCQLGPCMDSEGVASPGLTAAGPFAAYYQCCESSCDCSYECVEGGCSSSAQGVYQSIELCLDGCVDDGRLGRCCEILPPNTSLNSSNCFVKRGASPCLMTRSGCPPKTLDENGNVLVTRTWTAGLDCSTCPDTFYGACCLPDGTCQALCRNDCLTQGGVFKGASWLDCETRRYPDDGAVLPEYPCPNCNGDPDCPGVLTEVSCDECCHSYSADFTNPPSCPDGWELSLAPDAPSQCNKCEELPVGYAESDCPADDVNSVYVQQMVDHINASANKIADVTAQDVLFSGSSSTVASHYQCPDEKCYAGVTEETQCPDGNPLP